VRGASAAALHVLTSYYWPGNVRELRNAVERAMLLSGTDLLEPVDFPISTVSEPSGNPVELPQNGLNLEAVERGLVVQALERTGWNQTRAAKMLGLNRDQIRYRIEKFQLGRAEAVDES